MFQKKNSKYLVDFSVGKKTLKPGIKLSHLLLLIKNQKKKEKRKVPIRTD